MSTITHSLFPHGDAWGAAKSVFTIPTTHALTRESEKATEKPPVRILTLEDAAKQLGEGAKVYTTPARRRANQVKALLRMPLIIDVTKLSDKIDSGEIKSGHVTALAKRFLLPVSPGAIGYSAGKNGYDDDEQILNRYILIANLNEESAAILLGQIEELRAKGSDLVAQDYQHLWKLAESLQLQQGMAVTDVYSPPDTYTPSDLSPININKHGEGLYLKAGKDVPFVLLEGGDFCFLTASGPQRARDGKIIAVLKDGLWHGLQLEVFLRDNIKSDGTRLTKDDVRDFPSVTVVELLGACPLSKIKSVLAHKL
jgi:hypothetical protein